MKKRDQISGLVWLILGVFFFIGGIKYDVGGFRNPGPGFLPLFAGSLFALLGLILTLSTFSQDSGGKKEEKVKKKNNFKTKTWKTFLPPLLTLLILFGYAVLLESLGFLLTTFLCLFLFFKLSKPKRWLIPAIFSLIAVLLSHFIFSVWLKCQLPRGIFKYLYLSW